MTSF